MINWNEPLDSEKEYYLRYVKTLDKTERKLKNFKTASKRISFLKKIIHQYEKDVLFRRTIGVIDEDEIIGFGTYEYQYIEFIKLFLRQAYDMSNPPEDIKNKGRFIALERYYFCSPVLDNEGKLYQYYRDWVNYFEHGKDIPKISEKTVKKYLESLRLPGLSKITGKRNR